MPGHADEVRLVSTSRERTERLGEVLSEVVEAGSIVLLSGDLGAGKTQFTKGLARALGVAEPVTSPTFNILLVHNGRIPLYHFDLYRLETAEQLEDIDYWGTLEADGVSVVEWGDRFAEAMPEEGLAIRITITGDETREVRVTPLGAGSTGLLDAWVARLAPEGFLR